MAVWLDDQFASEGQLLGVRVPGHNETLWFVPEGRDTETLDREGVDRGRVWTARELMEVMALPDLPDDRDREDGFWERDRQGQAAVIWRRRLGGSQRGGAPDPRQLQLGLLRSASSTCAEQCAIVSRASDAQATHWGWSQPDKLQEP